jgi:hypothetical protein
MGTNNTLPRRERTQALTTKVLIEVRFAGDAAIQTYACDLRWIPVEDGRFDAVVQPGDGTRGGGTPSAAGADWLIYSGLFYEEHDQSCPRAYGGGIVGLARGIWCGRVAGRIQNS